MTKEFQQELKDKIKAGIKPSHLKRSKSADDLTPPSPPSQLLQDQLKEKQKEIENLRQKVDNSAKQIEKLRKQLEETNQKLTERNAELDASLQARYEAVKQFDKVYTKLQLVKQELDNQADEASTELLSQDQTITKLRTQQQQAQVKIQGLEKDLNLCQRLIKLKEFAPHSETAKNHWTPLIITLFLTIWFISLLNSSWRRNFNHHE